MRYTAFQHIIANNAPGEASSGFQSGKTTGEADFSLILAMEQRSAELALLNFSSPDGSQQTATPNQSESASLGNDGLDGLSTTPQLGKQKTKSLSEKHWLNGAKSVSKPDSGIGFINAMPLPSFAYQPTANQLPVGDSVAAPQTSVDETAGQSVGYSALPNIKENGSNVNADDPVIAKVQSVETTVANTGAYIPLSADETDSPIALKQEMPVSPGVQESVATFQKPVAELPTLELPPNQTEFHNPATLRSVTPGNNAIENTVLSVPPDVSPPVSNQEPYTDDPAIYRSYPLENSNPQTVSPPPVVQHTETPIIPGVRMENQNLRDMDMPVSTIMPQAEPQQRGAQIPVPVSVISPISNSETADVEAYKPTIENYIPTALSDSSRSEGSDILHHTDRAVFVKAPESTPPANSLPLRTITLASGKTIKLQINPTRNVGITSQIKATDVETLIQNTPPERPSNDNVVIVGDLARKEMPVSEATAVMPDTQVIQKANELSPQPKTPLVETTAVMPDMQVAQEANELSPQPDTPPVEITAVMPDTQVAQKVGESSPQPEPPFAKTTAVIPDTQVIQKANESSPQPKPPFVETTAVMPDTQVIQKAIFQRAVFQRNAQINYLHIILHQAFSYIWQLQFNYLFRGRTTDKQFRRNLVIFERYFEPNLSQMLRLKLD